MSEGALMDGMSMLRLLESAFTKCALIVVEEDVVVLWSKGAELLSGRTSHEMLGHLWSESFPAMTEVRELAEEITTHQHKDGSVIAIRRWSRVLSDEQAEPGARSHVEIWEPLSTETLGEIDGRQVLAYAKDIATSRATERQRSRELATALEELESTVKQLHAANASLEAQKHTLLDQVQGQTEQLDEVRAQLTELRGTDDGLTIFHGLISAHPRMHALFDLVRQIGPSDLSILIQGESGTGKELFARAVHAESRRHNKPFVAINCATLTTSLAESLLFGHKKGSFTSASADYDGVFAQADGGTLFLDEIAELPLEVQSKLLRAIQERVFTPLGGSGTREADVRLLAATHRDLRSEVEAGRFREDLMYRLRVAVLDIPRLSDRRSDVLELVRGFLARHNARAHRKIDSFSPSAVRALLDYPWPGNVRELENALEYAFAVARGKRVEAEDLPRDVLHPRASAATKEASVLVAETDQKGSVDEATQIRDALKKASGRISDAAKHLGMSRATFHRKRKRHGIA